MTDRGLPPVDGAPACPFVAFEDDRDERAQSPDHRHRCYAEVQPAPRAIAHQEAYCLSSAFPVCPTFQDWARREAARSRNEQAASAPPPPDREPQRNPPRRWTEPPPWLSGDPHDTDEERSARGAAAGLAGGAGAGLVGGAPPDFLASRGHDGQGLAGSAADRMANDFDATGGRDRAEDPRRTPDAVRRQQPPPPPEPVDEDDDFGEDDWEDDVDAAGPAAAAVGGSRPDRSTRAADRGAFDPSRERRARPRTSEVGPSWERPRRYEAYPTIKTRMAMPGMPPIPRLGVMAAALVVAALALFFLPTLLGVGGPNDPGTGRSSASPSTVPSAAASPAPTPVPTPQTYIVQSGDTMSKIANRFSVSLDDLIAANRETVPDADKLAIGDTVIIPVPGVPLPSAAGSASPSAAP